MKKAFSFLVLVFITSLSTHLWGNEIDRYLSTPQQNMGICDDATFLRRTYLTMTGQLPTIVEVKEFLKHKSTVKRDSLIDQILANESYTRYMTMRWGDILRIKSEFPSNLWPNGVQACNRWVYERVAQNMPYNQMIRELLLSQGSNFKNPSVNFYRAFLSKTPENIYANVNLLFLGQRKCDDKGAVFFSQIRYKSTKEWKEEIIYLDRFQKPESTAITLQSGDVVKIGDQADWRIPYVDWLTNNQNRRFAAVMANRVWYWIFNKGIVQEPDDWGDQNPPSNEALLNYLTDYFIANQYDIRKLTAHILQSKAFQSKVSEGSVYQPQRLPAEIIVDALADVTGVSDTYQSRVPEPFTIYPAKTRARDLGDATVSSTELELFGRVSRDVSFENQRKNTITGKQLLYLMNSSKLEGILRTSPVVKQLCMKTKELPMLVNSLFMLTLSRRAKPEEQALFLDYNKERQLAKKDFAVEVLWTLINSNEFLYNH